MEPNKYQIIGNEYEVLDYNLNKQFSNVKKVIITSEVILKSFENSKILELFENINLNDTEGFEELTSKNKLEEIFSSNITSEFYKTIQENLNNLYNEINNIKLNNYNFMNSMSNSKYNICLRTTNLSITSTYQEKGNLSSSIKSLIKKYISNKVNLLNLSQIKRFQIEIFESEEVYKNIFLKKDSNNILLSSSFGFKQDSPFDFSLGNEFYFSIGDDFKFYKNSQNNAMIREHNKITYKEINKQEKILSNEELILINKTTKDMQDILIEMYLNDKGKLRILNLSLLENNIYTHSENGFIINKSENNYDKISLLTLRDSFEEETINPKYLLVRNEHEVKEFLEDLSIIKHFDGIILTTNFYNPILDHIGKKFNLDIIFLNQNLSKSLEIKLDRENILIEGAVENSTNNSNPFSNILNNTNKEKDEFLEKLKNIDLSTSSNQIEKNNLEKQNISNVTNSLISSNNSSFNSYNSQHQAPTSLTNSSGKKLTAIQMLAQSALNPKPKIKEEIIEKNEFENLNNSKDFSNSSFVMDNVKPEDLNPIKKENVGFGMDAFDNVNQVSKNLEDTNNLNSKLEDTKKYENILSTKIITTPNINSNSYFVDINSISQINSGEIYFLTTTTQNLNNPNLNYVIPISITPRIENSYLLINSLEDFFLIDDEIKNKIFFSLSHIENNLKKNFIESAISKIGIINLVLSKEDLNLIENNINKIDKIFIKDLETEEEFEEIKNRILSFEKKYLIRNYNS